VNLSAGQTSNITLQVTKFQADNASQALNQTGFTLFYNVLATFDDTAPPKNNNNTSLGFDVQKTSES